MPRYFRLEEAMNVLPQVEPLVREGVRLKRDFETSDQELKDTSRNIMLMGGARVDPGRLLAVRQQRDQSAKRLQQLLEEISDLGAQVKDLDMGLIDFPAMYKGEEVCLCWKLGEKEIGYWHNVTDGFKGRKAIDAEFLEHHRGGGLT